MTIQLPKIFSLHTTINSHGWYGLPPFTTNEGLTELQCVITLTKTKHALVRIRENNSLLVISLVNSIRVTRTEKERIKNTVRSMLRVDESLDHFYALCKKEPHLRWVPKLRAGRLLRSQTLFEDVVKMMFTTNCSWALTKIQTTNLTEKLGVRISDSVFSFPPPEAVAGKSERWLRKELSCGYRAPYLLELCRKIADKKLDLESLRHSDLPTEEVYWKLRLIKGIGHYAAGNLLKLMGRYDYLGIDSWVRTRFAEIHRKNRPVKKDSIIESHYDRYGPWRGLVCVMEVTSDWHE